MAESYLVRAAERLRIEADGDPPPVSASVHFILMRDTLVLLYRLTEPLTLAWRREDRAYIEASLATEKSWRDVGLYVQMIIQYVIHEKAEKALGQLAIEEALE